MSYENSTVPIMWRSSYIRSIFKNGNKNDVTNYHGVAIQCGIIKLLDKNSTIERVSEIKDLGVIINEKLAFNNNIDHIIAKAKLIASFSHELIRR